METGLLSVNSGLVESTELKLLGTMSTVHDDENVVMADNLLDLELDAMVLSQSTRLPSVSRVPYKRVCDSQAMSSQFSKELCCKDPSRSNNNSAFLEPTRSPLSDGMPPLEVAWDEDPLPERSLHSVTSRQLPPSAHVGSIVTTAITSCSIK